MTSDPPRSGQVLRTLLWIAVALPAIYQIGLLLVAIAGRIGYPYDLEWMEGGMLHHAARIRDGEGIYVPPSVDWVPYPYTPLYPAILALFGGMFGISYTLGRALSVIALIGIAVVAALHFSNRRHGHTAAGPVLAGIALALGLFAAAYPLVEGWYDLVRNDALFLFMVTSALAGLSRWARTGTGIHGHGRVAAGGALLALAFFCKQTGIFYVGLGGAMVLVLAPRRLPIYVATAGLVGLGGAWLLQRTTDGWFWTYISKVHRSHDFSMDRFWKSFSNILWQPELGAIKFAPLGAAISIVIVATLLLLGITAWRRRRWPSQANPFVIWTVTYAVSTVVGAVGWGVEFAHFNAYIPALLHGALAAGAAIPAIYACAALLAQETTSPRRRRSAAIAAGAALAAAAVLAYACAIAQWSPRTFTPTAEDRAAGDRLIARLKQLEGEVWMPSHPWYLHLADKTPRAHRMSILDATWRQSRVIEGLEPALARHAFSALVLDAPNDIHNREVTGVARYYRPIFKLPRAGQCPPPCKDAAGATCEPCAAPGCVPPPCSERPRLFSGAKITPDSIWMPAVPATPPAGARVIFDFEGATWAGWETSGEAWGKGPVTTPATGQEMVFGATGARFATSMHGGDRSTGRLTSPAFQLDATRLTMRLGGGTDIYKLRVELWTQDMENNPNGTTGAVAQASVLLPGGDELREVTLDVSKFRGNPARLVLIDDSETGHLVIDDVWAWP